MQRSSRDISNDSAGIPVNFPQEFPWSIHIPVPGSRVVAMLQSYSVFLLVSVSRGRIIVWWRTTDRFQPLYVKEKKRKKKNKSQDLTYGGTCVQRCIWFWKLSTLNRLTRAVFRNEQSTNGRGASFPNLHLTRIIDVNRTEVNELPRFLYGYAWYH